MKKTKVASTTKKKLAKAKLNGTLKNIKNSKINLQGTKTKPRNNHLNDETQQRTNDLI